ncbi:conserved Plasmodium protein, unknown function [Plasmodium ovale]|uniref:B box-type domain-containing protein n=1 Tax=Plasmodium ovale TaxID=36330 RepID=A0A1C3KUU0_PLAOA|nr:conserved Plasmodium protein, unknown function [Plasmodium ovale]
METSREKREEEENFERAYRRIVVDGMFKEKQKEKNQLEDMLEISEIRDYNCLMKYEYILKLGFFSSNVNVLHVYRLVKEEYEKKFEDVAKCLGSTILISIVDTNDINDTCEHMEEYFLKNYEKLKQYSYVIGNTNYPLGFEKNRNGIFRVYLFKIIPNKTFLLNKGNFLYFDNKDIPTNYDSIAIERGLYYETKGLEKIDGIVEEKKKKLYLPNGNYNSCGENINYRSGISNSRNSLHYSYMYKVRNSEQILPFLLIEFEFKCLRVDISIPICEYCCTAKAVYYCYNDKAHLCDICDIKHHEKNKILKNHKRIHISESPFQFGKCPYHPNELVENVCMKCFCSLCPNCLLIGNHGRGNFRNHPITNIKDAFILSNQKKSLSDIAIENRKIKIVHLLKKKHKLLSEIYSNFTSLQKRIDILYKYIINELKYIKKKKINFLMALKRSVLSELLIIEWMEAFSFHTKLSLNLSDFILYQKKHQLLTEFLNRKINVDNTLLKFIPQWVFQKIHIHSNIFIYEDNFYKLNLSPNKCILFHNSKSDKTLHDNDNTLENNENKLKSMYNFNSAFNGGYRHFSMFDDDKCEVRQEDETHVAFSRIEQKGENLTPGEPSIDEEGKIGELCDVDMLDVKKMVHLKGDCSSVYELTKDKIMNCNLLYRIFRNEHGLDKHSEGMALKKSYMYRELWKNLVNYKYINVIHILKVRHSFNSLELVAAFLTISLHYDGLEDFVKHIIKHEIYTLLNKNIDYHTKMKVTQLMDNITTLLCIQRFRMSPLVDKYVQMCFLEVEKNKDSFLSDVQHICEEEGAHLYESYLAQRKNRCSEEAYTCPPDAAFSGVTPNKGVADGGNANGGSSSGGNANGDSSSGGNANGGSSSGGNANGDSSSGGNANGGSSSGGNANGDSSSGGNANGGSSSGGNANGDSSSGGNANGGSSSGGNANGDSSSGGNANGGSSSGGNANGDSSSGGNANGGSSSGGNANGDSSSGGNANGGSSSGGNANGDSSSGGNANGGSSSGGNANGDSSSGGNANGGSSSGGNANGSKSEPPVGEDGRRGEQKRESNILEVNCTVQEEDNTILDNVANAVWRNQPVEKDDLWSSSSANNRISDGEKEELAILKKLKEYIYIYVEKLIKDLVNTHHKDLNDNIRFLFYTIHDEIDGINRTVSMNGKKFSIHTLTLCLDLFLNSVLYPYIFYVHEEHVQAGVGGNSALRQKVTLLFGQTLREISIYVFQIYNMGMYDSNLKAFISNIKSNKMLAGRLFNWMVKNLEAPRYYAPVRWSYHENVEKSYEKVIKEILSINEYAMANCTNENVDYNILFSTTNFRDILSLCNSVTNDA